MRKIVCPDCGGHLVVEEAYKCSRLYKVSDTGKIYKRSKKVYGGPIAVTGVYCAKCGRKVGDKYAIDEDSVVPLLR